VANDRFGVRWGFAGGVAVASVAEARDAARFAEHAGFDSVWISQASGVDPIVALACAADAAPTLSEFGTSIVPLYGRHPLPLAQLTRTAQSALQGRFTLGIGAASGMYASKLGLAWDKPFSFTRDFIAGLMPLLYGEAADYAGEHLSTHAELAIDAQPTPVLLAALGPKMLRFAGAYVAGTTLGQCGPRTVAEYVLPALQEGAAVAGRTTPLRVMALVRDCVTEDVRAARRHAEEVSSFYQAFPSYQRVLGKEGLADPADLHVIGSWQYVLDSLAAYAEAGVTDLRVDVSTHDERSREVTRAALSDYLTKR
jgi:5,10-methylenetetrahydromethanopterin reductase